MMRKTCVVLQRILSTIDNPRQPFLPVGQICYMVANRMVVQDLQRLTYLQRSQRQHNCQERAGLR